MKHLTTFLIALAVTLGGLVAYEKFLLPKKVKKIYVVDTAKIVNLAKQKILLSAKNKDEQAFKEALNIDKSFQKAIKYIAKRDNAVVYPKKAIISGYDRDITNEVFILAGQQ